MSTPTSTHFRYIAPQLEEIPTSDGLHLRSDVYLPPEREGWPSSARWSTVLMRTPYGRRRPATMKLASLLARGGFAVLVQDLRGRYRSGGRFLEREGQDGLDTLAWLARQAWSSGRVGCCGISLSSYSLFQLAALEPPEGIEVCTVVNLAGAVDFHPAIYHGGALVLHWALPWCSMMHEKWSNRLGGWQQLPWEEHFRHLPLDTASEAVGGTLELWDDLFVRHPVKGEPWRPYDLRDELSALRIPVLHICGWYDYSLNQTLLAHDLLRNGSPQQTLMLGPWDHQSLFVALLGTMNEMARYGIETPINLTATLGDWFRRWLPRPEGGPTESASSAPPLPPTLLYVMGEDAWVGAQDFPVEGAVVESWYLTSGGRAAEVDGDGRLTRRAAAAGSDVFVYDPLDPVPTRGGAVWPFPKGGVVPGPLEQGEIEARGDVLVYTGEPLAEDLLVLGPVEVELWAASSCPDTDFTAKLVDVDPLGAARIVQDGIVRVRFHGGGAEERFLEPDQPTRLTISLGATGHAFRLGHRVRLEISSSNFPKYDRNLNTRAAPAAETHPAVARQRVCHGGERPSRLRLPVLARATLDALRWTPPASWTERSPLGS